MTSLKNKELLELQNTTGTNDTGSSNSTSQNDELVERIKVPGTGFEIVGNKEKGYFIALGTYRLTEFKSKEYCMKMIEIKDWDLIVSLIGAAIQADKRENAYANKSNGE